MKVHLHTTPAAVAAGAVTTDLLTLVDLVRHRVLRSNSEVWLSTESAYPVLWALDATSRCIVVHRARAAGVLRLTADRLRWSPAAKAAPLIDISAGTLTSSRTAKVQFVLMDSRGGEPLKVYDGGPNSLIHPGSDGTWHFGRWEVVDTGVSHVSELAGEPTELSVHEAHALGAGLLAAAVPDAEAAAVAADVAPVIAEITDQDLTAIGAVQVYAARVAEYVRGMVDMTGRELAGV